MTHVLIPLTKYPFLNGRKCIKSLYLEYWWPGLKSAPDAEQQRNFEIGNQVGLAGRLLYPGGVDLTEDNKIRGKKLLHRTSEALKSTQKTFYEAQFVTPCKQYVCRVDILQRNTEENIVVEIKSATSISYPEHLLDVGFQYMILKEVLTDKPLKIFIAHLNKDYHKKGKLETEKLFTVTDMTEMAKKVQPIIEKYIDIYSDVLGDRLPFETTVGKHCTKPHKCAFYEYCWKDIPKYSVFNVSRIQKAKAQELLESGVATPDQIPKGYKLSARQQIEVECATNGNPYLNKEEIFRFVDGLDANKGLFFLDFETMAPPIPMYEDMRCYQHICFQYSLIKKDANGKWYRGEFLAQPGKDPRRKFTESLLRNTEGEGKIVVFNKAFEISRLRELASQFPEYRSKIEERISRVVDLMVPFAEHHYYHPGFQGSFSLKNILPVLCPDYKGYSELAIKDGVSAMREYENLGKLTLEDQDRSRKALKDYCYTDTMAMVKIFYFLLKQSKS